MQFRNNNQLPLSAPICCPHCNSKNISFVSEYHKTLGVRIVFNVLIALLIFCSLMTIVDYIKSATIEASYIGLSITCAVLFACCKIIIDFTEKKTHTKAICRDCGKIWLID